MTLILDKRLSGGYYSLQSLAHRKGLTLEGLKEDYDISYNIDDDNKKFYVCKPKPTRYDVKVTFEDGNHILTGINGTKESIKEYYAIGKYFNLGRVGDDMQKVVEVEFLR